MAQQLQLWNQEALSAFHFHAMLDGAPRLGAEHRIVSVTFRTDRGGVDVVRVYREDASGSDVLAVDWTKNIKVTSVICARRITVS